MTPFKLYEDLLRQNLRLEQPEPIGPHLVAAPVPAMAEGEVEHV
jgi:hypothetical protein